MIKVKVVEYLCVIQPESDWSSDNMPPVVKKTAIPPKGFEDIVKIVRMDTGQFAHCTLCIVQSFP